MPTSPEPWIGNAASNSVGPARRVDWSDPIGVNIVLRSDAQEPCNKVALQMCATSDWSADTNWDEVCRRASGRRHFNAMRQLRAECRRDALIERALESVSCVTERGFQAAQARKFGVHRSTICRDMKLLLRRAVEEKHCPVCRRLVFLHV